MSQDWDIKACADACATCGKPFADQQPMVSCLRFGAEGYSRSDYCEGCGVPAEGGAAFSVWRGIFRLPPPPEEEPLKKETAETLLRKFIEKDDYGRKNAIYILAVMLERRRILVERDVQQKPDGTRVLVYEHRKTNETFLIPDPMLKLTELQHVQEEVMALLGGETAA
jgi:hypothetical protein